MLLLFMIITNTIFSQSSTWPMGKNASQINSTFGARDKYDNSYGYDFHRAIDLQASKEDDVHPTVAG
ncbi:MAG: hypothetical protein JEY94_19065 [Melioribacteraceae bacterium]|nr:hypothetical protein [Melioribacteraceae bacterium]